MNKRIIVIAIALAGIIAIGVATFAFNKNSEPGNAPAQGQKAEQVDRTKYSFLDADFARKMIIHHQQANEMADAVLQKTTDPDAKQLAQKIKDDNTPQIARFKSLLDEWKETYNNLSDFPQMSGHDMYPTLPGMAAPEDLQKWKATSGVEFDRTFLQMMLDHHKGAVESTKAYRQSGQFGELLNLAGKIEGAQTDDIAKIDELLARN
jgi:uncharacterized protein (DUF305 family)